MTNRRAFITGLASLIAAPAIVRVSSIMPIKVMPEPEVLYRTIHWWEDLTDVIYRIDPTETPFLEHANR